MTDAEQPRPMTPEEAKARRGRNVAIAVGLIAFVALVFVITLSRLKGVALTQTF